MFDYSIDVQDEQKVVRITLLGYVEKINLLDVINKQRSIARAKSYNRLYDFRKGSTSMSLTDLFFLPRNECKARSERSRLVKIALLIGDRNNRDDFDFYKVTAKSAGLNIQNFTSEVIAYKWLSN